MFGASRIVTTNIRPDRGEMSDLPQSVALQADGKSVVARTTAIDANFTVGEFVADDRSIQHPRRVVAKAVRPQRRSTAASIPAPAAVPVPVGGMVMAALVVVVVAGASATGPA